MDQVHVWITERDKLLGWYLAGPMVAVCMDHAGSAEDAEIPVEKPVIDVVPILEGQGRPSSVSGATICARCGESIIDGR